MGRRMFRVECAMAWRLEATPLHASFFSTQLPPSSPLTSSLCIIFSSIFSVFSAGVSVSKAGISVRAANA